MQSVWSVGLMTGTVLDGNIDVALLKTDGESVTEFGHWDLVPYSPETNELIRQAQSEAEKWNFCGEEPPSFQVAEEALTTAQADAVKKVVTAAGLTAADIAVVGFHGQTILHQPPQKGSLGKTRQLGDGNLMANLLSVKVAYDFRSEDMAKGGQGAPLSPVYHAALLNSKPEMTDCAIVNLGGVANLTWWNGGNEIYGFDTGPANAPINDWVNKHGFGPFDNNGMVAAAGTVDEQRLATIMDNAYFRQKPPKSLDRNGFTASLADGLSVEDGAATLTALCATAIGEGLKLLPKRPEHAILCGGGRKNPTLVREIEARGNVVTSNSDLLGWRGDALEAECFAFLAMRVIRGIPISYPSTTGVNEPSTGGKIAIP